MAPVSGVDDAIDMAHSFGRCGPRLAGRALRASALEVIVRSYKNGDQPVATPSRFHAHINSTAWMERLRRKSPAQRPGSLAYLVGVVVPPAFLPVPYHGRLMASAGATRGFLFSDLRGYT